MALESRKKEGTRRTRTPTSVLRSFESCVLPAFLDTELRIVAHEDALQTQDEELTAIHEATQAELDTLLPSVLDRAFRGS